MQGAAHSGHQRHTGGIGAHPTKRTTEEIVISQNIYDDMQKKVPNWRDIDIVKKNKYVIQLTIDTHNGMPTALALMSKPNLPAAFAAAVQKTRSEMHLQMQGWSLTASSSRTSGTCERLW